MRTRRVRARASASPCHASMSLAGELRELKQLHADGVLTDQEFTDAKAAVTQQVASGSPTAGKKKVR